MNDPDSINLRLVEADEDQAGRQEDQDENTPDQFAPVGTVKVLAAAFRTIMERLKSLESAHRGIRLDDDYVARKSAFMAAGRMADANAAESGQIYTEFENAFYWLHGVVSGYFDQVAEIYLGPSGSARNAQGSVNTYLPNTVDSLLKNTFAVERTRYIQEAISAAAALVVLGLLPAGLRQVHAEYRSHVAKKVLAIIRDMGGEKAFRYLPDRDLFRLLGASTADFERHFGGQIPPKNTEVAMTIFAIRSRIETPNRESIDAAARITNLTPLSLVS